MHYTQHRFDRTSNQDFYKTLKQRIDNYFEENGISKKGGRKMVIKTIAMVLIFGIPYALMISGLVTATLPFIGLWFLMGLGVAGIGSSIMHDANHGSYSSNNRVNRIMSFSMDLVGGNALIWRLQHNVLHHTYTNIQGADEDIDGPPVLRFSPNQEHKFIHRFQHIHAWLFYPLMSFVKVIYTDFEQAFHYRKIGLIKSQSELNKALLNIAFGKVVYLGYMLLIPMLLLPESPWIIIAGFLVMHGVTGLSLSIVFQSAHVMPDSKFPLPESNGNMQNEWALHQLLTTTNFAPKNKWLSWFIGGLNFQVEHHLFSNISHIHYPQISKIVKETALEFKLPYRSRNTFREAIADHARMLYILSKPPETVKVVNH